MLGRPGFDIGRGNLETIHITGIGFNILLDNLCPGAVLLLSPIDNLIVNIRIIFNIGHPEPRKGKIPTEHIKNHGASGMPQVPVIIDGDPAHIHPDKVIFEGDKLFFLFREGIK